MNNDKITNADPARVARASFAILNRLQDFPKEEQPLAAAAVFLTLADHLGVPAQDLFTFTKNLMNSKEGLRPEFGGVRDYIKYEIKR